LIGKPTNQNNQNNQTNQTKPNQTKPTKPTKPNKPNKQPNKKQTMLDYVVYHHDGRAGHWHHCPIGGSLSAALVEMRAVCQSRTQNMCTSAKYYTVFNDLDDPAVRHTVVLFCKFGKLISRLKKNRHFWNLVIDVTHADYAGLVVRCPLDESASLGLVSQKENQLPVLHEKNTLLELVTKLASTGDVVVRDGVYQLSNADTWWGIVRDPDSAIQQYTKYKKRVSMMAAHHVDHCVAQPEQFVTAYVHADRTVHSFGTSDCCQHLDEAVDLVANELDGGYEVLSYSDALNSLVMKQPVRTSVFGLLAKHVAQTAKPDQADQADKPDQPDHPDKPVLVDTANKTCEAVDLVDALYYLAQLVEQVGHNEDFEIKVFDNGYQVACMLSYFDAQQFHTAGLFGKLVDLPEKANQDNLFWFDV
jgi:hypothetical protein